MNAFFTARRQIWPVALAVVAAGSLLVSDISIAVPS